MANQGEFTNFSKLKRDCPRCGEENDKCGWFEDSGIVLCRTDIGDSTEPKVDANGWEYWPYQICDGDQYSEIYQQFCNALSLSLDDQQALLARGLSEAQVTTNQYKTIPHRSGNEGLNAVIDQLDNRYSLEGTPGFYLNEGKRTANVNYKQTLIPVRNFRGAITQFVLRNNSAQKGNRRKSKYLMLSSDGKEDGKGVIPAIHFPLGTDQCGHEVRITEGILKADVATALGEIYCLGLHGLSSKGLVAAIELLGVSKVRLSLDIDWQTNNQVLNGLRRIYQSVVNAGFEVVVEEWNKADGKGIDDVLLAHGKIWALAKEELDYFLDCPRFNREDWVFINQTSQFADISLDPPYLMDEKHFNNQFAKVKENFAKEAKAMVKQTNGLTYLPKGERIVLEGDFFNLNTWGDTGIAPVDGEGDLSLFFAHVDYLFPGDNEQKEMLLDWMANMVQHRGKKFSYALVLHGKEGTGKTWMLHCLRLLLGKSNVKTVSNDYISGSFNSLLESRELLIINEIMASGRRDFMNKMKDYIDTDEIIINKKCIPEYVMPFNTNWFMTTNYDDALLIDDNDRRYLVLSSPAECGDEQEANARGDRLFRWSGGGKEQFPINEANIGALHAYLLARQVKYSPFAKAPLTQAKSHMQEESLTVFEKFVKERIEEEIWPFNTDLVCIEHLKLLPAVERRFERISDHRWGKTLRKFGALPYGVKFGSDGQIIKHTAQKIEMKSENGKQRRLWILRRHQMYAELGWAAIEELYLKKKPPQEPPEYEPIGGGDEPL